MSPYIPDALPLEGLDYQLLFRLVGPASAELARYDGLLQGIPNPEVMLSRLTIQEAVLSSRIEGTQATVDEVPETKLRSQSFVKVARSIVSTPPLSQIVIAKGFAGLK